MSNTNISEKKHEPLRTSQGRLSYALLCLGWPRNRRYDNQALSVDKQYSRCKRYCGNPAYNDVSKHLPASFLHTHCPVPFRHRHAWHLQRRPDCSVVPALTVPEELCRSLAKDLSTIGVIAEAPAKEVDAACASAVARG